MTARTPHEVPSSAAAVVVRTYRWLLFVHQLPSTPSNLRVRTWRRLQQIGALPLKQALYVLPDTPAAREDFEWLKTEIEAAGGQASVYAADGVDSWSNDALVEEFRRTRQVSYQALARDAEQLLKRLAPSRTKTAHRRNLAQLKERLASVERIDFFGSAGRDRVATMIQQLEARGSAPDKGDGRSHTAARGEYRGRVWVTRPRPGVDRMASAWLIRRFIDAQAKFAFVPDRAATPAGAVPFDMFGVEFTHHADLCTFEVLCERFGLQEPPLSRIAAIVHDLDLKEDRYSPPEAPTMQLLIEGLRLTHDDDNTLLDAGRSLFESLYRSLSQVLRVRGPRPVARARNTTTRKSSRSSKRR